MNYWYSLQERIFHQQTSRFTLALHGTLGSGEEMEDQHSHPHLSPGQGLKNSPHSSAVTTVLFFSGMYCNKTLNIKKGVSSRLLEVHYTYIPYTSYMYLTLSLHPQVTSFRIQILSS